MGEISDLFHSAPDWRGSVEKLRDLDREHGGDARDRALNYAAVYSGARGAMIVDVVASRQRRYQSRVMQIVSDWKNANAEHTIAWLADHRPEREDYGLADNEVDTIQEVAKRLCSFAAHRRANSSGAAARSKASVKPESGHAAKDPFYPFR